MTPSRKLLLVGWDGADWPTLRPLMARGQLPVLRRITETGVSGDLYPSASPTPMAWTTLATGHHPAEHGIVGTWSWDNTTRTVQPAGSHRRKRQALWTIFSHHGRPAHVVGWPASHRAEIVNGVALSDAFDQFGDNTAEPPLGSVFPPDLAADLQGCRVPPHEVERGLLRWFSPGMTPPRLQRDPRAQRLLHHLSRLYTRHNAAIDIATHQPPGLLALHFPFIASVRRDFAAYTDPQRPDVLPVDFQLYREVLNRACMLQDLLLGELLRELGPDTSVLLVSPQGVVAANGPLFHDGGGTTETASLLDLAPTLLHAAGLPVGRDMPGRVLTSLARNPSPTAFVVSWEAHAGGLSRRSAEPLPDAGAAPARLPADPCWVRHEQARHLGRALLEADRLEEALTCFHEAWFHRPEQPQVTLSLVHCLAQLRLVDDARALLGSLYDHIGTGPAVHAMLASAALDLTDYADALAHAHRAIEEGAPRQQLWPLIGRARLHLKQWPEAEAEARAWLIEQPGDLVARHVLLRALFHAGRLDEAKVEALSLTVSRPDLELPWFTLGQIELKQGHAAAAKAAHARALALRPTLISATAGLRLAEDALRLAQGRFASREFKDFDFRETPDTHRARVTTDHVSRVRSAFCAQFDALTQERATARAAHTPLVIQPAATLPPDFTLRSPWPDELPRLEALLGPIPRHASLQARVLVRSAPERIIGGFVIAPPPAPHRPGALTTYLSPGYNKDGVHEKLLNAALDLAKAAQLPGLVATLPSTAPERALYLLHGATLLKAERFYEGDLEVAHRRLHPMLARLPAFAAGCVVRPLAAADHPTVAKMAHAHGLLNEARAESTLRSDYAHDLSLVCVAGEQIVGAMLVKPMDRGQIYVEIRMVHPEHAAQSGPINMLLITHACERCLAAGFTTFSLSCQPTKDVETVNFARRMRCREVRELHTLAWKTASIQTS